MKIGVPKEIGEEERRVALVPESVGRLVREGYEVLVEKGAGAAAGFLDDEYEKKKAVIVESAAKVFGDADVTLKVNAPNMDEIGMMKDGSALISFLWPHLIEKEIEALRSKKISAYAMDRVPRITRAQTMDALSSMSSLAGYKCVIDAAGVLPKLFPMMMTAAGTIAPAKVFVLGAGVAGLQAIATAKRLGARVEAYDVRPAVKEEVESLGAKFVEVELSGEDAQDKGGYAKAQSEEFLKKQREMMLKNVAKADVVITTALVPGKKAPILVTEEMLKAMSPGSVVVDLASEQGGNCELSEAGAKKVVHGVTVVGMKNVASEVAYHASQMYSRNITALVTLMTRDEKFNPDPEDEIVSETLATGKKLDEEKAPEVKTAEKKEDSNGD